MLVPHHAITEFLAPWEIEIPGTPDENAGYLWVEVFSAEIGFESRDTIYVAELSSMQDVQIPEGFLCVCLKNTGRGNKIGTLARALKSYVLKLQEWEKDMIEYVMEKDLINLLRQAGTIIGCSLLMYNDTFRLLAYHVTDANDEMYYSDLIKANVSRVDIENDFSDPGLSIPPTGFVARTLFVQGYPRGQIYMFTGAEKATRGELALFGILLEWIQVFFEREAPIVETSKNIEAFLIDLIENRSTDPISVSNRADYCGIPADKPYCLFVVRFKSYFRDIEVNQLLKKLAGKLPDSRILPYNENILIVNYFKDTASRDEAEDWVTEIRGILKSANAEMGLSMPEVSLRNMHLSYKRAVMAIEYGKRIHLKRSIDAGGSVDVNRYQGYDIYAYETYYVYHIIDKIHEENRTILEGSHCIRALAKLYAFDRENKTDNLQLLYSYLINERSASKTAAIMHMHRNNVIYRIKRIEQILGIDFDEYHYRFKFLLSYRVIDYYGLDYLKAIDYTTVGTDVSRISRDEKHTV